MTNLNEIQEMIDLAIEDFSSRLEDEVKHMISLTNDDHAKEALAAVGIALVNNRHNLFRRIIHANRESAP